MKKEDMMWQFIAIGFAVAAVVLILDVIFVAPFIQNGIIIAFIIFGLSIASMFILAVIKDFFIQRMEKNKKDEPPMTEKEQIEKYGGRVILSFTNVPGFGNALTIFLIGSFVLVLLLNLIPYNIASSGVNIETLPIYGFLNQLTDSPVFAIQIILVFGVPGLHILAVLMGLLGLNS